MKADENCSCFQGKKVARHALLQRWLASCLLTAILFITPSGQMVSSRAVNGLSSPEVAWNIQYIHSPANFFNMTDRAFAYRPFDSAPCTAFGGDRLYYSCYNNTTKAWNTVVVDDGLRVGEDASLAFNKNSWPFIAYYDAYLGRLKLAFNTGGGWIIKVIDQPAPDEFIAPETPPTEEAPPTEESPVAGDIDFEGLLQEWRQSVTPSNPLTPNIQLAKKGVGRFTSIDVDIENQVHISYYDEINGDLKYAFWDGVNLVIQTIDYYNDQGDVGLWTSIVVDDRFKNVHIAYMSEKYDDIKYARGKPNGDWKKCTVFGSDPFNPRNVGSFASIALEDEGSVTPPRIHISYLDFTSIRDGDTNLMHSWLASTGVCDGNRSDWNTSMIDGQNSKEVLGWYTSIAVDYNDKVHISYFDASKGKLKYIRGEPGKWDAPRTLHDYGIDGMYTSLALSPGTALPGITFYNATFGVMQYMYKLSTGTNWSAAQDVFYFSRDVGLATSLDINSEGVPFVSYLDTTQGVLRYARSFGTFWHTAPVMGYAGLYSSIKLGADYAPRIAYYSTLYGDLQFATWAGGIWKHRRVDTWGDTGQYVSLAIGPGDIQHISYYDATRANLMYTRGDLAVSPWITETLDLVGDVGKYTSIALDAFNRPAIAYYDDTNDQLKFEFKTFIDAWAIPVVVDNGLRPGDPLYPVHDVGQYTSIAFDRTLDPGESNYDVHITYYDATTRDLLVVTGNWNEMTFTWNFTAPAIVDGLGGLDVGQWSSLAVDKSDNLHVCYYDATNGALMYGTGPASPPWALETVDDVGDVGYYCSLDLTYRTIPPAPEEMIMAITYYDNSRGDLKIALSYTLPNARYYLPVIVNEP